MIECRLERDGNITVNMGAPVLHPDRIPFIAAQPQIVYDLQVRSPLCNTQERVNIAAVSMGNPHAVLTVDDVETAPVSQLGPLIEAHERFPQRVNVGFMQVIERNRINLRVFERGVGETRACGTGAAAAMVAGRLQGLLDARVEVALPGGVLTLAWEGDDAPVYMTGPACRVYEGRLQI